MNFKKNFAPEQLGEEACAMKAVVKFKFFRGNVVDV
jgi:hypothetical protein